MKKAKKKPSKRGGLKDIEVTVTVSGETLTVDPLTARIKKKGEQVKWTCKGGRMSIDFDHANSPFGDFGFAAPADRSRSRKSVSGESVIMLAAGQTKSYKYTMTVNPNGGRPQIVIDPQVDVNDPGHPGPHGKKAARKATKKTAGKKKK